LNQQICYLIHQHFSVDFISSAAINNNNDNQMAPACQMSLN